jgi:hypothetical protein
MEFTMNIQGTRTEMAAQTAKSKQKAKKAATDLQSEAFDCDSYAAEQNEYLLQELRNQSDVRPAVLNRARQLVANPGYPSDEIIRTIARLLTQTSGTQL